MTQQKFNSNQPEYYAHIGKGGIVKEGIFARFPELIPAVGDGYWRTDDKHCKMLLVAESNYFDDNDIANCDFLDAEKWYTASDARLIPDYRRSSVSNFISYGPFNIVFKIMNHVLDENAIDHLDGLGEASFYNYFLRPAYKNGGHRGFIPQPIDCEVAGEALAGIIDTIAPGLIIFLSKKAYLSFNDYRNAKHIVYENIVIDHVSHPSSIWWIRNKGQYGKARFESLLKTYWIQH